MGECGFDEILAEVPQRARKFAKIAENVVECGDKAIDLLLADDQGRQDLHDVGVVGGDLSEDSVFLKKGSDDHLGEETLVHCMDGFPGEFEFESAAQRRADQGGEVRHRVTGWRRRSRSVDPVAGQDVVAGGLRARGR